MTTPSFSDLGLIAPLCRALDALGYATPTPIQAQAIPSLLAGRDLLGCAQTGTGKTAAFALPILQHLAEQRLRPRPRGTRALVLTPTRELAVQILDSFRDYGRHLGLRLGVVFGGVGQVPQVRACAAGLDVLVATPGRLLDLMGQGHLRLDGLSHFVLDEADRMLDMGFLPDVKRVMAALPARRQTLLFSATMPASIAELAGGLLGDPVRVAVAPQATPVERIEQKVLFVAKEDKRALLGEMLKDPHIARALVFTRTKHGADRVAKALIQAHVRADAIHGNKSQNARQAALQRFRGGQTRVLVATDLAARGLDVEGVTHVINFDLPNEPESYVHRIGRTARAGADGVAISFCDAEERVFLRDIQELIRQTVPVVEDHPYRLAITPLPSRSARPPLPPRSAGRPARPTRPARGGRDWPRRPGQGARSGRAGAPAR